MENVLEQNYKSYLSSAWPPVAILQYGSTELAIFLFWLSFLLIRRFLLLLLAASALCDFTLFGFFGLAEPGAGKLPGPCCCDWSFEGTCKRTKEHSQEARSWRRTWSACTQSTRTRSSILAPSTHTHTHAHYAHAYKVHADDAHTHTHMKRKPKIVHFHETSKYKNGIYARESFLQGAA